MKGCRTVKAEQKRQYIFGGIVAAAVLICIIAVFMLLSKTDLMEISIPQMIWAGGTNWCRGRKRGP